MAVYFASATLYTFLYTLHTPPVYLSLPGLAWGVYRDTHRLHNPCTVFQRLTININTLIFTIYYQQGTLAVLLYMIGI